MDKNKIHGFMDSLNLLLIGAIIGCIIGACFMSNYCNLNYHQAQQREWCDHCLLHSTLQDHLQGYYLKLVKHKG